MPIITVISDIHVAHPAAVWPKSFKTAKGVTILPSPAQKVMLEYWDDFFSQPDVKDSEYLLNLDESIEGYNKKEHGKDIMTSNLNEQVDAFVQLLSPKIKGKQYVCVDGSGYHGSEDTSVAEHICGKLKGEYFGQLVNWEVKGTGRIVHATHKASGAMLYKATALDRRSLYMSAAKSKVGMDPDIMISGHIHQYFRVDTMTRINVTCPCWKFWHPIKTAESYPFSQPSVGGVTLKVSKKFCEVDKYLYPLEHVYDVLVKM
jgi:hypothetical protein